MKQWLALVYELSMKEMLQANLKMNLISSLYIPMHIISKDVRLFIFYFGILQIVSQLTSKFFSSQNTIYLEIP